jgi:hypothetical protein
VGGGGCSWFTRRREGAKGVVEMPEGEALRRRIPFLFGFARISA